MGEIADDLHAAEGRQAEQLLYDEGRWEQEIRVLADGE